MRMYNRRCRVKARGFKLPSLEALAVLMRTCAGANGPCHEDGLRGAKLDIANCYWSVCLPPDVVGAIWVAAGNCTYALLRVPFGWHQAPGLVQALIADLLRDLDPDGVVVVQYLDDVLFIGRDRAQVAAVAEDAAYTVRRAKFLVSDKSKLGPQRWIAWMGKALDLSRGRIAPLPSSVAAAVLAWVRLALRHYTYVQLRRLLGKVGWLGKPENMTRPFLAGARAWLRWGPKWAWRCPPDVVRGVCEAVAMSGRGWEPDTVPGTADTPPAHRVFVDAARTGRTTGDRSSYVVGSWGPTGAALDPCPPWITNQQSAELWGTIVALDQAISCGARQLLLIGDNAGAIAQLPWGRASPTKPQQQRILRRVAHKLRWAGVTITAAWAPSRLNPADPVSRALDGRGARHAVLEAVAKEALWDQSPQWPPAVADRDKSVRPWSGPVSSWGGG